MKPFVGKVEIEKTYLDTWGRSHTIHGYVVLRRGWKASGENDTLDKSKMWSGSGWHFDVKTGSDGYGHQLVQLTNPQEERRFWLDRITQIRSVNHEENLKLVQPELDTMHQRTIELTKILQNIT